METFESVSLIERYTAHLARLPLSEHTCSAYTTQVGKFLAYVAAHPPEHGDPFSDEHARDHAARDFKTFLKVSHLAKPATVNLALAAIENFFAFLGMGPPKVAREPLLATAPKALTVDEQRRFMRAAERCDSSRDQAIVSVLIHAALRVSEAVALDTADVAVTARRGMVTVRDGKGSAYREVPLNTEARTALAAWLRERGALFPDMKDRGALFLSRTGSRLTRRALDQIVRGIGVDAGLELSCHTLRHTCLTRLVRDGKQDLVLVAEVAGHRRLDTTRRYVLPTAADRAKAMELVSVEY
jgi:integrase/recombinase XerC